MAHSTSFVVLVSVSVTSLIWLCVALAQSEQFPTLLSNRQRPSTSPYFAQTASPDHLIDSALDSYSPVTPQFPPIIERAHVSNQRSPVASAATSGWGAEIREVRDLLTALFEESGGMQWRRKRSWMSSKHYCEWEGVGCERGDNEGWVVGRLSLYKNGLTGNIPSRICRLPSLRVLDFSKNRLTGALDTLLGCSQLERIELNGNLLSGGVPNGLGDLRLLKQLFLQDNKLSGPLPPSLGWLGRLMDVDVSRNSLQGTLPEAWANLTALQFLAMDENNLVGGIPEAWGSLVSLEHLYLANNKLGGCLPKQMSGMRQLEELDLHDNQLSCSIPTEFIALKKLKAMDIKGNPQLKGKVPPQAKQKACPH